MSQSSSDSPGPQRARRSPVAHAPYDVSSQRSGRRPNGENWNPMGPGQPGDFASQYPAYSSNFSMGYDQTPAPLSSVHNHSHARRMPALSAVNIDELSNEYGLNATQRNDDRLAMVFLMLQRMERQNEDLKNQLTDLHSRVEAIGAFCAENWKPSKEQVKLLKSLLRHYIIRPITSYTNLISIVEPYIYDHAKRLRLELYKQDPTVKTVVHDLLVTENGTIFTSVLEKKSLMTFSKKIINTYHLPAIPHTSPPQDIMACFALMREVARPLAAKKFARGGDSKFWSNLEDELDNLFGGNGGNRGNLEWLEWERQVIQQDNNRYDRFGAETTARSQEEIDAAVPSAADHEEDNNDGTEDRDVTVDNLGDLAALAAGPVAR
ncbi:hypothetical protein B0H14DRAFT_3729009 [Mycena olivaceomarginata]|nr:hypothetical protein B0H14DRAFT_3729009 [Mycena olivaceomarginata]